jgi:hypothetical protein
MSASFNPVSQIPNFGHAWSLTVTNPPDGNGNSKQTTIDSLAWTPEPLEIEFEVNIIGYSSHSAFWTAKIEIFNLSADQAQQFIFGQGATVILSAGYQVPGPQIIFAGVVYQALYERPEVVDSKVTLMCYTGLAETIANFAAFRGTAMMTQSALIAKMCAGALTPIPIDPAAALSSLPTTQLPRARPFFGNPHKYINDVAAANNMQSWYGSDGVSVSTMAADDSTSTITYTPSSGIIGVPQQTQDGVQLVVLLDNRLRVQNPPMQINIASSVIRQLQFTPPGYRPILDPNGLYLVNGVQHRGNSRNNLWESEILAMTSIGGKAAYVIDATTPSTTLDRRSQR